jgi:hypothetical protein
MMLNKEECEKALDILEEQHDYLRFNMQSNYPYTIALIEKVQNCFKQLIKEHFELVEDYKKLEISDASKEECTIEQYREIKQLRSELNKFKNPQPYKFEDLKEGMWVWDNLNKDCRQIARVNEYGGIYWYGSLSEYESDKFEENRFYPVTKAMQYQEELLSRKEDNNE